MSTQPDPKDTSLDELEYFAKAWVKYISVATLAGDSAPTLSGTKSAIRGYDNVAEDFTKSLQSLLSQQRAKLFEQIRSEVIGDDEYPDEHFPVYLGHKDDALAKKFDEVVTRDRLKTKQREALTRLEKEHE